jgi:hypothetical protein
MQSDHRRKVLIAIAGAVPAVCIIGLVWYFAQNIFSFVEVPADSPGDRLAFVARWMPLPGLSLLVGVVFAARRGFYANAIDGTRAPANYSMEINLRYNTNTLEQTVLAGIAWAGLAVAIPIPSLILIPAMATLFFIGRTTFWVGYLIHPMGRAFGMTLTALPIMGSYAWLVFHLRL